MASVNWKKLKTSTEVKAIMRHNEQAKRQETGEHSNLDIDRSRTHLNFSVVGRSYADRCKMYDDAMIDAANYSKRKLRADAVTCLSLCTTMPDGLDDAQAHNWFSRVHELMCEQFGVSNVIDTDVHMDEIHEYYDPDKDEVVKSRPHAHTAVIPRTLDGRLCCKEVSSRSSIMALNATIEDMTQREYGIHFMTGEGKKGKSVERCKAESVIAAQNEEQRAITHRHMLVEKNAELNKRNAALFDELQKQNQKLEFAKESVKEIEEKLTIKQRTFVRNKEKHEMFIKNREEEINRRLEDIIKINSEYEKALEDIRKVLSTIKASAVKKAFEDRINDSLRKRAALTAELDAYVNNITQKSKFKERNITL
ncbi:MAG: plasmid recombination protein [Ruminococcus sp.]|nr:plasmid recombination protein [Ruminococcus sp.]